jgi:MFS family permease
MFKFKGWISIAVAPNPVVLFIGRFVQGLSDATCVTPSLLFASEISRATLNDASPTSKATSYMGTLLNSASVMANVGVPVAYVVASLLSWLVKYSFHA